MASTPGSPFKRTPNVFISVHYNKNYDAVYNIEEGIKSKERTLFTDSTISIYLGWFPKANSTHKVMLGLSANAVSWLSSLNIDTYAPARQSAGISMDGGIQRMNAYHDTFPQRPAL